MINSIRVSNHSDWLQAGFSDQFGHLHFLYRLPTILHALAMKQHSAQAHRDFSDEPAQQNDCLRIYGKIAASERSGAGFFASADLDDWFSFAPLCLEIVAEICDEFFVVKHSKGEMLIIIHVGQSKLLTKYKGGHR